MQSLRQRIPRAARAFSTTPARPLSKVQLIGRLGAAPEATPTSTGRDVVRYALAVNHGSKDESGNRATSWFKIASFAEGPQKDLLLSLEKGTMMFVEAEARMDSYESTAGEKRTSLNLLQRNFELISSPRPAASEHEVPEGNVVEAASAGQ